MNLSSATEVIPNSTLAVPNTTSGPAVAGAMTGFADEPLWSAIIRFVIAATIFIVGVIGNCLVCVVVFKNHRMQTAMNMFLVNLAICDIFVCVINIIFTLIYWELKYWPFGLVWCKMLPTLQIMNIAASTGSLVAMSVERYRAICMPMSLPLSRSQAKLAIALAWTIGLFVALPEAGAYTLVKNKQFGCMESDWPIDILGRIYSMFLFVAMYLLPLLFLLPAYIHMIYKLWAVEEMKTTTTGVIQGDPQALKRRKNVLMMMAIVVASYAICLMPYHGVYLWMDYGTGYQFNYIIVLLSYMQIISWFNSCVNPIIYWFFSEQFSKEFNKILGCQRLKRRRRLSFTHSSSDQNQSNTPGHTLSTNTHPNKV